MTINEHTPDKYQKLKRIVHESVPSNLPTRLTGWDTLKFGVNETAQYDRQWPENFFNVTTFLISLTHQRVLLDAPCSNEKSVFNDEKQLKKWTDKVSRQNAKKQLLWLISALASTKPGGSGNTLLVLSTLNVFIVLYVARTMSVYEMDEIIEKAMKKSRVESTPVKISLEVGSMTKYGWLIMPDSDKNLGPLYLAKLKVSE